MEKLWGKNKSKAIFKYANKLTLLTLLSFTTIFGANALINNTTTNTKAINPNQFDFDFTGETELFVAPEAGTYLIQAWGAQGGHRDPNVPGGKGGFTSGEIELYKGEELFVTVGGKGDHISKGFNGGGLSAHSGDATYGGGASDIRVGGTSVFHRILVAGGGGASSVNYQGGAGGGLNGLEAVGGNATYKGKGATQTSSSGNRTGSYGLGGIGYRASTATTYNSGAGGGGGGWFGGGGGYEYNANLFTAGGGGSGYIFTEISYKPTNYALNTKYYLSNPQLLSGNDSIFNKDGVRENGHEGDGFLRITYINPNLTSASNLRDIKINGVSLDGFNENTLYYEVLIPETFVGSKEITVTKDFLNQKVDGDGQIDFTKGDIHHIVRVYSEDDLQCKDYVIHFKREYSTKLYSLESPGYKFVDDEAFNHNNYDYSINAFQNNLIDLKYSTFDDKATVTVEGLDKITVGNNLVKVIVTREGITPTTYTININTSYSLDYIYKGREQQFIAPYTGEYKLDLWGAQGGQRSGGVKGGLGGYSSGVIRLEKGELLYLYVGGKGDIDSQGFNGGGKSGHTADVTYGGGATDIRISGRSLYNRVIVAGGGGASTMLYQGGSGGGINGIDGQGYNTANNGKGASQIESAGLYQGSFGLGGDGYVHTYGGSGGGGGWYGGGGSHLYGGTPTSLVQYAGGGGSGYIFTDKSIKPSQFTLEDKYKMTHADYGEIGNKDIGTWKQSFIDVDGRRVDGHEGDGHIRIAYLDQSYSSCSDLRNIYVDGIELEGFDPNVYEYNQFIEGDYIGTKEITVQKHLIDEVVVGTGYIDLNTGDYTHFITVISSDSSTSKTYKINFIRKNSTKLKELSIKNHVYKDDIVFNPSTYNYVVETFLEGNIEIDFVKFNSNAEVLVEGMNSIKEGNNIVTVKVNAENTVETIYTINIIKKTSLDYIYKGREQQFIAPYTGEYKLELWGAQGGQITEGVKGGLGGFSSGVIRLKKGDLLYLYVGGKGDIESQGFNGGGKSGSNLELVYVGPYGGGATDIRISGSSLYNRIIVAGGGGASTELYQGGAGGGINGFDGRGDNNNNGKGASQTESARYLLGIFGNGGGIGATNTVGGGGGWYGGGGGYSLPTSYQNAGGGGSGYIFTETSYKLADYTIEDKYKITQADYGEIGNKEFGTWKQSFIDVDGKRVDGHEGDGHIRITYYSDILENSTEVNMIKFNGEDIDGFARDKHEYTIEIDGEFVGEAEFVFDKRYLKQEIIGEKTIMLTNHNITKVFTVISGNKQNQSTYTINIVRKPSSKLFDLKVDEYKNSFTEPFKSDKFSYQLSIYVYGEVKINATTFDKDAVVTILGAREEELRPGNNKVSVIVSRQGLQDSVYELNVYRNRNMEFSYQGKQETFIIPYTGIYKLELWGAQGGQRNEEVEGGKGGYVSGEYYLKKGETIFITVGGKGDPISKGFNGGGLSAHSGDATYGGGASDIRVSGNGLYNRIIVAGGGGASSVNYQGGAGGGFNGFDSDGSPPYVAYHGKGALQTSGQGRRSGSFGAGGLGNRGSTSYNNGAGGGGGGWFGGGGGDEYLSYYYTAGGGGSGYIFTETSFRPVNYTPSPSYYASNPILIPGNEEMPGKDGYTSIGNSGDGFARISLLNLYSKDARLKYLDISAGTMNRSFDPDILEYDIVLEPDETEISISGDTIDNNAEVMWEKDTEFTVLPGITVYKITTTAQDGTTLTYTLRIHRAPSSTSFLSDLQIDGITIDGFTPDKLEYYLYLPYDAEREATVSWSESRPMQRISTVNSSPLSRVSIPNTIQFENNVPVIISVISEDDSSQSEYSITPIIEDSNLLKSLKVDHIDFDFDKDVFSYDLDVPVSISSLEIDAVAFDHEAEIVITGNGYLRVGTNRIVITVKEPNIGNQEYILNVVRTSSTEGAIDVEYEYSYTGDIQYFEAPYTGNYKLQVWGAEGGNRGSASGGKGGYSSGIVKLTKGEVVAVYVGGAGTKEQKGFNGGASSGTINVYGGGASDIRVGSQNDYSLFNRIIVAGGGGSVGAPSRYGSAGGGLIGITSSQNYGAGGQGGTQTNAGNRGGFGYGGTGLYQSNGRGGAGGGGWYGGGGVTPDGSGDDDRGGGGGSGYVFTQDSKKPANYNVDPKYHLTDTQCIDGAKSIPNKDGGYSTGNSGNGFARITALRQASTDNFLKTIELNGNAIMTPEFNVETLSYEVKMDSGQTELLVRGITMDPLATVQGNGSYIIDSTGKTLELTVTAEDGSTRVYTLNISREASNNALPLGIEITGLIPSLCKESKDYCKLSPEFIPSINVESGTGIYSITVPSRILSLEFTVIKGHFFQEVIGGGVVHLEPGSDNTVYVEVSSEDGSEYSSYIFVIERDMTGNTDLEKLEINYPKRDIEFHPDITEYYVSVPNEIDHTDLLEMTIETVDPNANFMIEGKGELQIGNNILEITCVANNGNTKKYTLFVYRETNSNVFLKSLIVMDGTEPKMISPIFRMTINEYLLKVEHDVSEVEIIAEAECDTTSVNLPLDGIYKLDVGKNVINVVTTAENGENNIYTVTVIREGSGNNRIKSIYLDDEEIDNFDPNQLSYTLTVESQTLKQVLRVTLEHENASYIIKSPYISLKPGDNKVGIQVIAENGDVKYYSLNIIKEVSSDATLKSIKGSLFDISDRFDPEVLEYEINLPNTTEPLIVEAETTHITSTLKGNGKYYITSGANEVKLQVIAEDLSTKMYTLKINMLKNTNAELKSLKTNYGSLDPIFNSKETQYTLNVPNEIDSINVSGLPSSTFTTVNGNGLHYLNVGENIITISTVAENGKKMSYVISVIRDKSNIADLAYLVVHEGAFHRDFLSSITEYDLKVPYGTRRLTIEAGVADPLSTYSILNSDNLKQGMNEVTVRVTSAKKDVIKDYILNVFVQAPSTEDIDLTKLSVNPGELQPIFSPSKQYYKVTVGNNITSINVLASTANGISIVGTGSHKLEIGRNRIVVRTIASNDVIKDYQIEVNRSLSSDARLQNPSITGAITPIVWIPDNYEYNISTYRQELIIKPTTMHPNATFTIMGNEGFITDAKSVVRIRVTAEDGITQKDYVFNVTKKASPNNNLKGLSISGLHFEPEFSKERYYYSATVPSDVTQVSVTAIADDINAKTRFAKVHDLQIGKNFINIEVIAENGSIRKYTVVVERLGSTINTLSSLSIDGEMVEGFNEDILYYNYNCELEKETITLDGILSDPQSTVIGLGQRKLKVGLNDIKVVVISEGGSSKIYSISVIREPINSPLIENLAVNQYPFDSDFSSSVKNYNITVDNEFDSLQLDIKLLDPKATFEVVGNKELVEGNNEIKINVVSSMGDKSETYVINAFKQAYANNFLAYLQTNVGKLQPQFYKGQMVYTMELTYEESEINITGEPVELSTTVAGLGLKQLDYGINKFKITARANNGIVRTYHIIVNRSKSHDNYLNSLVIEREGKKLDFSPAFDPKINSYTLNDDVQERTEFLNIIATSNSKNVVGKNTQTIRVGANKLEVVVTSESGLENTYVINYNRLASDDNNLTSIIPSTGDLMPNFIFTQKEYNLKVDTNETTLSFSVNKQDKNAIVTGTQWEVVPVGDSTRVIKVTAENGDVQEYVIHIQKDEINNTNLKTLSVDGFALNTVFSPNRYTYGLTVPNSKKTLYQRDVKYELEDTNARVQTTGDISLNTGVAFNQYELVVTAVDGFTTETYRLQVAREESSQSTLEKIHFSKGRLSQSFNKLVYEYDLEFTGTDIKFSKNDILEIIPTDSKSTISFSHNDPITIEEGKIIPFVITSISEDGTSKTEYTFNLTYSRSNDNRLSNIIIENAIFTPAFNPNILEYDISVHEDVSNVVILAYARHPKATLLSALGNKELINHTNIMEIKVEAENGSIATYKLKIKRDLSNSIELENIELNNSQGVKLSPSYDPFLSSYQANVIREVDKVGLIVTKGHSSQSFTLLDKYSNIIDINNINLKLGKNLFKLVINSPFGDTRSIDFTINRESDSNTLLESLVVSNPVVDLEFDPNIMEYFIDIPSDYDSIHVEARPAQTTSKVDIFHADNLVAGNNEVLVRVTAESGVTRHYALHVFKKSEHDNTLETISVSTGSMESSDPTIFTPHFKKGVTSYSVKLKSTDKEVLVEGVAKDPTTITSTIDNVDQIIDTTKHGILVSLKPGNNVVKMTTENNGDILVYTINLIREMSDDANLKGLEVFNGEELLMFNENEGYFNDMRNFYTLDITSEISKFHVFAIPANPSSKVVVSGNELLLNGDNVIRVTVTSQDRTRSKIYTIVVSRTLPKNTKLNELAISHGSAPRTLFNVNDANEEYVYNVPSNIDRVTVDGKTSDPLANVNGFGQFSLNYGDNEIVVTVKAQSGHIQSYKITVTRAYDNELESLRINQGQLTPEFSTDHEDGFEYSVWVPIEVDRIHIEGIAKNSPIATVLGNGWYPLSIGANNPKKITVESPDGTSKSAFIKVVRSASANNRLQSLDLDQGKLTPTFNPGVYAYDTYVKDTVSTINFTVIPEHENATFEVIEPEDATIQGNQVKIVGVTEDLFTVRIRVTAENGDKKDTVINVHRQPAALFSNLLSSLEVTPVKSTSPLFNPNSNNYVSIVDESTTHVTIKATKQSADATIVSGLGTQRIEPGRNVFEIEVESKDGIKNIYKVVINQVKSGDASLRDLSFDEGYLTPIFTRGNKEYRMNVSANTNFLTETIIPNANGTTWSISGGGYTEELVMGENTIVINTLAANGIGIDKYTVIVNKTNQTSVYLKELSSNIGNFTSKFNKYFEGPYTLEIDTNTNSLMLSGRAEEPESIELIKGLGIIDMVGLNNKTVTVEVIGKAGNTMSYTIEIVRKLNDDVKLSYLALNPGTLVPSFNPNISKYTVTVPNDVDRIEILANTNNSAEIIGTGVKVLDVGNQEFTITLTTETGSIGVYSIEVEREAVHSAKITNLTFKEALIDSPIFDKDDINYLLYVPYEVEKLTIDQIEFEDPNNIEYTLNQTNFRVGNNTVTIDVKNKLSGETMTYTFMVTRYAFSSNFLSHLTTDKGLLSPSFDRELNNYDIDVPYNTTEIELIGTKEDATASEVGIGPHKDLEVGINTLKVVITSAQGVPRTYIVRVHRLPDSNKSLIDLHVTGGSISPSFGLSEFNEYTINVDSDTNIISLTGVIPNTATVEGLENLNQIQDTDTQEATLDILVDKAEVKHEIIVRAQDGTTKKYKFSIKKQLSTNAEITSIIPSKGELEPIFSPNTDTYTVTVEDSVSRLGFNVVTSNQFAKVTGHEEKNLSYGDNTFTIVSTSENGAVTKSYTVNVIRQKDIHGLSITNENLVISVGESKLLELVYTPNDATNLDVTWISDNPDAVSVDAEGNVTGVGSGSATITVYSNKNLNIKATAVVEVLRLRIESDVIEIVRGALTETDIKDYVIGAEQMTSINQFVELFANESSTLKVFNRNNVEITDYEVFVGTEMILKLIVNDIKYDELIVLIRGDNNGDGIIIVNDLHELNDLLSGSGEITEIHQILHDYNRDGTMLVNDAFYLEDYLSGSETGLN